MSNFVNLKEALRSMEADPSTAHDPIKRMFLFDGDFATADVAVIEDATNALHRHKEHDEFLVILDGEGSFRVGEEQRNVRPGDLIFVPRNTLHGPSPAEGRRLQVLSVFAPYFDRAQPDIEWEREGPA